VIFVRRFALHCGRTVGADLWQPSEIIRIGRLPHSRQNQPADNLHTGQCSGSPATVRLWIFEKQTGANSNHAVASGIFDIVGEQDISRSDHGSAGWSMRACEPTTTAARQTLPPKQAVKRTDVLGVVAVVPAVVSDDFNSSRSGRAGNGAPGKVWYSMLPAISSCRGR
jgi:hypothetical protein